MLILIIWNKLQRFHYYKKKDSFDFFIGDSEPEPVKTRNILVDPGP
jgi:hypothetical protein